MFFKIIALLIEVFNWILIMLSPTGFGFIFGISIAAYFKNWFGIALGSIVFLTGFVTGIIWATRIWKRRGTTFFMSRIMASPDIDEAIRKKDKVL